MLALFFAWFFCSFIFLSFGKLWITILDRDKENTAYNFPDMFFTGMGCVGSIICFLSLFFPVNSTTAWGLFIIAVLYNFYLYQFRKDYYLNKLYVLFQSLSTCTKTLLLVLLGVILVFSLLPPILIDTGLYHLQAIIWNQHYAVVPGLGNIHGRFGFNSSILLLSSVFSFDDIFDMKIYGIVSLSTFIFIAWLILRIAITASLWKKCVLAFFCFAFLYCYKDNLSSPSTDVLPNILVAYLVLRFFFDRNSLYTSKLTYWILPVFAVTLKMSVIPICLFYLPVCYHIIREKKYYLLATISITGIVVIVPWIIRNIILTGYLIYPYPGIDLFTFDWKIPLEWVQEEKALVSSWAKMPGLEVEEFEKISFSEWSRDWFFRHWNGLKIYLALYFLAGISPVILAFYYLKKKFVPTTSQLYAWLIVFTGYLFLILVAPSFRFGFSFILLSALLPLLIMDIPIKNKFFQKVPAVFLFLSFFLTGIISYKFYNKYGDRTLFHTLWYTPYSIETVKNTEPLEFIEHQVGDIRIYTASYSLCYDKTIPCAPAYYFSNNLEMRGKYIQEGFRIKSN